SLQIREVLPRDLEFQMFVMDELADAALRRGEDVIKLTIGITDLPPPQRVVESIAASVRDLALTRRVYPEGLPELREAIARYEAEEHGVAIDPRQVLVGTGTSAVIRNLLQLVCRPGDEVLIPRPHYCLYRICALLAGARVTYYDIDLATLRVDLDSFRRAYDPDRTAVVVINNPGNPAGNVLTEHEVRAIYAMIGGRSYVVNDEIYANCCFER